jgi:hypothetical protein
VSRDRESTNDRERSPCSAMPTGRSQPRLSSVSPSLRGFFGRTQKVTARGMARAVTDTTFGGKGGDRTVAGGTISYGVDISVGVPDQQDRSKRIRCRVHWGPIRQVRRIPRRTLDFCPLPDAPEWRSRARAGREACGILITVSGERSGGACRALPNGCLGQTRAGTTPRRVMLTDRQRPSTRGEQRFRAYLW